MKILPITDEKELLLKLRDGDQGAFNKIYNSYKDHIIAHLLFLLKSDELVQDVAQETFIAVWEKRKDLNPGKSFKSFLYTIATNKTYDLLRKASHDKRLQAALATYLDQSSNLVDEYIRNKEYKAQMESILSKMPEQQRKIYRLAKIEGYSYDEIAEQVGISRHTVNTHIKRANLFLKQQIVTRPELFALIAGIALGSASYEC